MDGDVFARKVVLGGEVRGSVVAEERAKFTRAAGEEDLVNSGLEETMAVAYREVWETWKRLDADVDLRTAAMVNAIEKVAVTYEELGIFP